MANDLPAANVDTSQASSSRRSNVLGLITIGLGIITLLFPLGQEEVIGGRAGLFLIFTSIIEFAHAFRRSRRSEQRSAWISSAITLAMGVLLINSPFIASKALVLFFAGWFGLDGIRYLIKFFRGNYPEQGRLYCIAALIGNLLVCGGLLIFREVAMSWTVALAAALRMFCTASNIFAMPVFTTADSDSTVVHDLHMPDNEELKQLAERLRDQELSRIAIDRGWIIGFILTLFAIHLGRMGLDRTVLGVFSPLIAVVGDIFMGFLVAFLVVIPVRSLWLYSTSRFDRRSWQWVLLKSPEERGIGRRLVQTWLMYRLRTSIRLRQARYSFRRAISRGLQIGLPIAAIIAATFPIWGMSWYFDTENWAAGVWNSWAASRTDTWREAMALAVLNEEGTTEPGKTFAVHPPGIQGKGDYSFIVIGDTGEGDASQHVLRSQYLDVVRRDEVKFVVISSDVVYPTGGMRDYEAKFWLPFMGTTKPVYAIPGNHDWYDALEGFVATFMEPKAARTAMRARIEVDRFITTTTEKHVDYLINEATRLRNEYRVPVQFQKAPYFQIQTETFALFAVDTGVVKRIDAAQMIWLKRALEAAKGKTKMAILGHPLYAGGEYLAEENEDFAELHQLLREYDVSIIMAGDTHDLEYYAEQPKDSSKLFQHFVNGGGGAYLSFGTSLAWPEKVPAAQWAYYPAKEQVISKIEATTPSWKWPAWWWTKHMGGWPFSAEFLSAAFDANAAPYYQSFMEIRVENSKRRLVLIPYGIHGRLKWTDLDRSSGVMPVDSKPDSLVEWIVEMK